MKGDVENHSEGPYSLAAQWLGIIRYQQETSQDSNNLVGKFYLECLFPGYALYAEEIWKGEVTVADIEEPEKLAASEIHARRLNAKEVLMPKNWNHFKCPIADGRVKLSRAGLPKIHLKIRITLHVEKSTTMIFEESRTALIHQTRLRMTVKPETIFWTIARNCICRHHVEPRSKLCAERRIIPNTTAGH